MTSLTLFNDKEIREFPTALLEIHETLMEELCSLLHLYILIVEILSTCRFHRERERVYFEIQPKF